MKKEIIIKHELYVPEKTFDELTSKIRNEDTLKTGPDLAEILKVRKSLSETKKEFMDKVNEQLASFKEYEENIENFIEKELKPRYLEYVNATGVTKVKNKMDKNGDVIEVEEFEYKLPEGVVYKSGTTTFEYNESMFGDEFFKKTLKKTEAKKAWTNGEVPKEAVSAVKGAPSISITEDKVIKTLEAKDE